ncbi:MAG TPA: hypothetical protein VF310_08215 [Vicinamibacteria bacterium]
MKKLAGLAVVLLLAGAAPVLADHPGSATPADLRMLQNEVDRLDDSMARVDDGNPRAREFRDRENEIRDRLVTLRTQIRRHQQDPNRGLGATKSEVDSIQQDIVSLRRAVDDSSSVAGDSRDARIPDGTEIQVRLEQPLSSRTARREDRVVATVAESVRADGRVVIPAGTEVRGVVREVEPAQRADGGRVDVAFDELRLGNRTVNIQARPVSVDEGRIDKKKAGLGAILGGVIGGVLDGKKGAVIGAILGGTGAVVATKGNEDELPAGTHMTLRLDRPVDMVRR